MMSSKDRYAELVALTQLYLLQEHGPEDRLMAESGTYTYFREYALRKQKQAPAQTQQPVQPQVVQPVQRSNPTSPIPPAAPPPIVAAPTPKAPEEIKPAEITPIGKALSTKQEVIPTEREKKKSTAVFQLDTFTTPAAVDFKDIRSIIQERFPQMAILNAIPDDSEAKKTSRAWEQPLKHVNVLIVSLDEAPKNRYFLANIAAALESYGVSTSITMASGREKSSDWETKLVSTELRLVLVTQHCLEALPELGKLYREEAKQARCYLGKTPLLLMSDIGFYLKEPQLKSSLWNALKELLFKNKAAA